MWRSLCAAPELSSSACIGHGMTAPSTNTILSPSFHGRLGNSTNKPNVTRPEQFKKAEVVSFATPWQLRQCSKQKSHLPCLVQNWCFNQCFMQRNIALRIIHRYYLLSYLSTFFYSTFLVKLVRWSGPVLRYFAILLKQFDIQAGVYTLPDNAIAGNGWCCYRKNRGVHVLNSHERLRFR